VLDVRGVRKEFGGLVAVNDVSFEVRAGEILGLIGPERRRQVDVFNLVTGCAAGDRGQVPPRRRAHRSPDLAGIARRRLPHLSSTSR
jgi:ABC-type branched-subunit amino acid transport system ATPase component